MVQRTFLCFRCCQRRCCLLPCGWGEVTLLREGGVQAVLDELSKERLGPGGKCSFAACGSMLTAFATQGTLSARETERSWCYGWFSRQGACLQMLGVNKGPRRRLHSLSAGPQQREVSEPRLLPGPLQRSRGARAAEPLQNAAGCLRLAPAALVPQRGVTEGGPKAGTALLLGCGSA